MARRMRWNTSSSMAVDFNASVSDWLRLRRLLRLGEAGINGIRIVTSGS